MNLKIWKNSYTKRGERDRFTKEESKYLSIRKRGYSRSYAIAANANHYHLHS